MEAEVYYFSGTGNSLVVARDIAKEIGGTAIPIASVMGKDSIKTDAKVIGIVFPVYMWGPPLIVERFVGKLENLGAKYVFAIATYGGMAGRPLSLVEKTIQKRGGNLAAGFEVRMPGNYTPMYGAIALEKQQKMFNRWHQKISKVGEYIRSERQGGIEKPHLLLSLIANPIYHKGSKHIPEMDKNFRTDEKCNQCGICRQICPVNNILTPEGKPQWQGHCEQCFACLQWCPKQAIQYGNNTVGRKRYHHPEVQLAEMLQQTRE